jgi:hypothetical protein
VPANPAWLVIDMDLDGPSTVRISDIMGRAMDEIPLKEHQRLLELDLRRYANGLYTCELLHGEYKLGAIKLTVQH